MSNYDMEEDEDPTILEMALGRTWTKADSERLLERMDKEVSSLGDEAESLYRHHFCDVVADPEPEYVAAFERAIYQEFAYLRSEGYLGHDDHNDEIMADEILSMLDKYLMLGVDDDDDLVDENESDDEMSSVCFETRSCEGWHMDEEEEEKEEDDICVICLDGLYGPENEIATIACRHEFHRKCIFRWLQETDRCPLCKAKAVAY